MVVPAHGACEVADPGIDLDLGRAPLVGQHDERIKADLVHRVGRAGADRGSAIVDDRTGRHVAAPPVGRCRDLVPGGAGRDGLGIVEVVPGRIESRCISGDAPELDIDAARAGTGVAFVYAAAIAYRG